MIDQVLLARIEEGLRTDTKVVVPRGYHVRADYIDILLRKGWGKGQIERVTGWNMWEGRNKPTAVISQPYKVHVESVPAGTPIHGVDGGKNVPKWDAVVLSVGPLKLVLEGNVEAIEEIAARMVQSARAMQADVMELGA